MCFAEFATFTSSTLSMNPRFSWSATISPYALRRWGVMLRRRTMERVLFSQAVYLERSGGCSFFHGNLAV